MLRKLTALFVALVTAGVVVAIRFANPDMTETRLFLAFWPLWLICLFALALAAHIGARL